MFNRRGSNSCILLGFITVSAVLAPCQVKAAAGFSSTGSMNQSRIYHAATLLNNGTVLVTGGTTATGQPTNTAEIYNPQTGTWRYTGIGQQTLMNSPRATHTATRLSDGRVLLAGGYSAAGGATTLSTEIFDPATEAFTLTGQLNNTHTFAHTLLLNDGRVIVIGGGTIASEIYSPNLGTWDANVPALPTGYLGSTSVLLPTGGVFVAGGENGCCAPFSTAALYTPTTNAVTSLANLLTARIEGTGTLLPSGKLLIAGGVDTTFTLSSTELYDPAVLPNGQSQAAANLNQSRRDHTSTLLPTGDVLVAGGAQGVPGTANTILQSAEIWNHVTQTWSLTGPMSNPRSWHTATLLPSGAVLVAGGGIAYPDVPTNTAEIWAPASNPQELYSTPLYSDPSLIGYWRFEGNSHDSKGLYNGTDFNIFYGSQYGKFGQGASFDGSSSHIVVPSPSVLDEFSVSFWVYKTNAAYSYLISKDSGSPRSFTFEGDNTAITFYTFYCSNYANGGCAQGVHYIGNITSGWHHLVGTFKKGDYQHFYVDGVEVGTPIPAAVSIPASNVPIWIGAAGHTSAGDAYTQGYLDDMAIFSRVLSPSEVSNLYSGNFPPGPGQLPGGVSLVDPVPTLLNGPAITTAPSKLASQGRAVRGVSADGATTVVVRIPCNQASQQLNVKILNDATPPMASTSTDEDGVLATITSGGWQFQTSPGVTSATCTAVSGTPFAFFAYRAPIDFVKPSGFDQNASLRTVSLMIQDKATGTAETVPVSIARPPVVLVHGHWGSSDDWVGFAPLINSTIFTVTTVNYSRIFGSTLIATSNPQYSRDILDSLNGNALGFAFNAPTVLMQVKSILTAFGDSDNVAAVQADVVAHSMGGDITRMLPNLPNYFEAATFGAGRIHKLVTINTPHLGTPLATRLLQSSNSCLQNLLASNGSVALTSVTTTTGQTVTGSTGDLSGDGVGNSVSPAISTMQHASHHIPIAAIGSQVDSLMLSELDCPSSASACSTSPTPIVCEAAHGCRAAQIRFMCQTDDLSADLTSSAWASVVGNSSDAIVPITSQLDSPAANVYSTTIVALHSAGVEQLGFGGPSVLDASSGAANSVITLLNTSVRRFATVYK